MATSPSSSAAAAARPPVVSRLSPASGPTAGGTRVTITGTGFQHVKSVAFGAVAGRSLRVESSTKLVVTSPKAAAGAANVRVRTTAGTSRIVAADRFAYVAPPVIRSVAAASGTTAGGQTVTLTGSGFTGIRSVDFGTVAGRRITIISASRLSVTSPRHAAGRVGIRVTGTYGVSAATSRAYYAFVAPAPPPAVGWVAAAMPYTDGSGAHSGVSIAGVSCPAAASCIAVGQALGDPDSSSSSTNPLAETYAHGAWTGQVLPQVASDSNGYLSAVWCSSSTACVAVGRGYSSATGAELLVETLSGTTWSGTHLALPAGATRATLGAIWCQSTSVCVAVGSSSAGADDSPLVETLTGGSWVATTPPGTSGFPEGDLAGISCTGASACAAVGSADDPNTPGSVVPLVETFNGQTWTASSPPVPDGAISGSLTAVSCPASAQCVAVGDDDAAGGTPLVEQQSPTGWTPTGLALVRGHFDGQLDSVSCAAMTTCTAVGGDTVPTATSPEDLPLSETLSSGTWTPENPPVPQNADGFLKGVGCTGATSCVAVGNRNIDETGGLIFSDTRS